MPDHNTLTLAFAWIGVYVTVLATVLAVLLAGERLIRAVRRRRAAWPTRRDT